MKNLFSFTLVLCTSVLLAQVPNSFNYQSIVRDGFGALVSSQQLGVKVSIVKDSLGGNVQYSETHSPTTNSNGLFSIQIGEGNATTGVFDSISWEQGGLYYLVEVDLHGGSNYGLNSFHSFTSVPYSKYAESSKSSIESETSAYSDSSSYANNGVPVGGNASQVLTKASNTDYDVTWVDGTAGSNKYLLRLEYDINEALINGQGSFVTTGGFSSGGSIDSYTVGSGGGNNGHFVTVSFANETTPPVAIFAYAWQPMTGRYKVTNYDNDDVAQIYFNTTFSDLAHQSTNEGGSGIAGHWAANTSLFTGFGSYSLTLPVEQSVLKYANSIPGGFGNPTKYTHVYILFAF